MLLPAFDEAFEKVGKLVATFKANERRYLSTDYQEAEARKDFIDKFWTALGWDVNHDVQTNPYEQEVKVERGMAAGGQRRADYAFYLAPNFRDPCFFVEAKKPHGDIATKENYFQLIRYGWNSQTSLAVLTDFEQFHVLDCRYKPDLDTALNRYVARYHYSDYTNKKKFAEIYWLFSHEAVEGGSLEKRAKELPKPRGKAVQRGLFPGAYKPVDESFLEELDEFRTSLAHAFKNKNPKLDSAALTELAQRTLDRLVFLRFLEDKGIETRRHIDAFGDKGSAWEDFIAISRRLDGIYNGIVFKEHTILDALTFRVDDNAFADICEGLAHVNSPYDFNAIPIHILGSIYERFLGKVIVATDKRVTVEEKPEVRKAGGVYYTPEYIVRYIVANTVGKLIEGKTPDKIAEMRFADIACGSGSFLLGIYDLLLQYHGKYYNTNPKKARKGDCIERDGKLYLSLRKKREILLNNIYGVDIDAQAVEVCQLSLYLKLLKEETVGSTHEYQLEFHETLLPSLSKNIVCGNSLIGTDILEGQLFPGNEERKLNPMNFEDAFPEIMKAGGFDAIVGNPPWISAWTGEEQVRSYLTRKLPELTGHWDTYIAFLEKSLTLLNSTGRHAFIYPTSILTEPYAKEIRKKLIETGALTDLAIFGAERVFASVSRKVCILVIALGERNAKVNLHKWESGLIADTSQVDPSAWLANHNFIFSVDVSEQAAGIRHKIEEDSIQVGNVYYVNYGAQISSKVKGAFSQDRLLSTTRKGNAKRCLCGSSVKRYLTDWEGLFLDYQPKIMYGPRHPRFFESPKIIFNKTSSKGYGLVATFDDSGYYCDQRVVCLVRYDYLKDTPLKLQFAGFKRLSTSESELYHTGVLNSSLLTYWFVNFVATKNLQGEYTDVLPKMVRGLPIRRMNLSDPADQARHDQMVRLVEQMLAAKKELAKAKTDKDKTYYESKCDSLDHQIDRLVYDLYDLTDDEKKLVESSFAKASTVAKASSFAEASEDKMADGTVDKESTTKS